MGFKKVFQFSRERLHNSSTNPIYLSKWRGEETALGFIDLGDSAKSLHTFGTLALESGMTLREKLFSLHSFSTLLVGFRRVEIRL